MQINDFTPILSLLKNADPGKRILVLTHERPDGDAIGSACAMTLLLNGNGLPADLFLPDAIPDAYQSFVGTLTDLPDSAALHERYSMIVNTDASTVKRLGLGTIDFQSIAIPFVTLDHHPDNEIFGTFSYVDPGACSASELVYEFARAASWRISEQAATLLLLGITTDSGCFRFDNTTPRAHRAAADLLELGADQHGIIEKAYLSKPFNMALFEAELLCHGLKTAFDGRFAWFLLDNELLKKYSIDIRNTENLIEILRGIDGVQIAALLKATAAPGIFKISLRSKNPALSVGRIARKLNGGGHEMAAGGTIYAKTIEEAEETLIRKVELEFKNEAKKS